MISLSFFTLVIIFKMIITNRIIDSMPAETKRPFYVFPISCRALALSSKLHFANSIIITCVFGDKSFKIIVQNLKFCVIQVYITILLVFLWR